LALRAAVAQAHVEGDVAEAVAKTTVSEALSDSLRPDGHASCQGGHAEGPSGLTPVPSLPNAAAEGPCVPSSGIEPAALNPAGSIDWPAVIARAHERCCEEGSGAHCPICIGKLHRWSQQQRQTLQQPNSSNLGQPSRGRAIDGGSRSSIAGPAGLGCSQAHGRAIAVLSCSHAFHLHCICAFEAFELAAGGTPSCPVCRAAPYERRCVVAVPGMAGAAAEATHGSRWKAGVAGAGPAVRQPADNAAVTSRSGGRARAGCGTSCAGARAVIWESVD
jgi:hypothetical protein